MQSLEFSVLTKENHGWGLKTNWRWFKEKKKLNYNKPLNLITTLIPNGVNMFYFYLILTLIKGLAKYYVMFYYIMEIHYSVYYTKYSDIKIIDHFILFIWNLPYLEKRLFIWDSKHMCIFPRPFLEKMLVK